MPALTVLTIGVTLSFAMKRAWERRGVFLTFAQTAGEAVPLLRNGDFDLCLVDQSVPGESRAKLVEFVREKLQCNVPVISVDGEVPRVESPGSLESLPPNGVAIVEQLVSEAKRSSVVAIDQFGRRYKRTG